MSLKKYLLQKWKLSLIVLFLIVLGEFCLVFWGFSTSKLLTFIAAKDQHSFKVWLIIMIIDIVLWISQIYLIKVYFQKLVQEISIEMRSEISSRLFHSNYDDYSSKDTGAYVSYLTNDIDIIHDYGLYILYIIISQISSIIFCILATVYFHYSLLVTILLLTIIIFYGPKYFNNKVQEKMKKVSLSNEFLINNLTDIFQGYDDLLMMDQEEYMINRVDRASENLATEKIEYASISGKMLGLTNGISLLSQVILFAQTSILYFNNILPIGAISGVQYFSAVIFSSMTGLSANIIELKTLNPVFEKFNAISTQEESGKIKLNGLNKKIVIENLNYRYGDMTIFENFSQTFEKNKKYIIVGKSGKGKSTLLNILSGKVDNYDGQIKWDEINYKTIGLNNIRNQITYIRQDPYIFNASIKENLTFGSNIDQIEINKVLNEVGLKDWIDSLANGLDTIMNLSAKNISGGQKQRIALARGLLRKKSVILLDEPTSSLDENSAYELEKLLFSKSDLTVIMVTHNLREDIRLISDEIIRL